MTDAPKPGDKIITTPDTPGLLVRAIEALWSAGAWLVMGSDRKAHVITRASEQPDTDRTHWKE